MLSTPPTRGSHLGLTSRRRRQVFRATTNLANSWLEQGCCIEAHDLLAPVYDWFTEGFDTADLREAKTLLEQLS